MNNVIVIDINEDFIIDLQQSIIFNQPKNIKIISGQDLTEVPKLLQKYNPVLVVLSSETINENVLPEINTDIVQYSHDNDELQNCNYDYSSFGVINYTDELLECIERHVETITSERKNDKPAKKTQTKKQDTVETRPKTKQQSFKESFSQNNGESDEEEYQDNDYEVEEDEPVPIKQEKKAKPTEERTSQSVNKAKKEKKDKNMVSQAVKHATEPARGIAVYSAKGGVGKTTIACELASLLALTEHGRGNYKVCIADFNIDFGDVLNQLDFDPDKPCMTLWIADIRARLASGEEADEIEYTSGQISAYLQEKKETGLFALLAPLTNQDSMDITAEELDIMVRNLIENGGFDFVIFDTGNNTRDSSYIPMTYSEQVLVVLTQSINTANCCNGFFSIMSKIKFDMSKFKLVINRVQSTKSTGIDTNELKETFQNVRDKNGRLMYSISECYAEIKESSDVINSSNEGKPMVVTNPSHEFSRAIGAIAGKLTKQEFVLPDQPKKKGFLSKLFAKK